MPVAALQLQLLPAEPGGLWLQLLGLGKEKDVPLLAFCSLRSSPRALRPPCPRLCGAEPGASPSRQQLGALTERGCVGTAGEDRAAAGHGLNASLAAPELWCGRNSAPRPLLEPHRIICGRKKESRAALRNVSVSILSSIPFFLCVCVWCYCSCPCVVVGRIKGC